MQPGDLLREGGRCPTETNRSIIKDTELTPSEVLPVHGVNKTLSPPNVKTELSQKKKLVKLDAQQQAAFEKVRECVPPYYRGITSDFEKEVWSTADIEALADLLCKYQHRFSQHHTDFGHVTVVPFLVIQKKTRVQ